MKRMIALLMVVLFLGGMGAAVAETVTPTDTPAPAATPTATYTPDELLQQWYQIGAMLREYGNYPFTELRKGDKGYEVQALQTRLAELGYYTKKVVDNFGTGTYTAMRLFEKANQLTVDGIASVSDQQALYSTTAVAYSSKSSTSSGTTSNKTGNRNSSDATSGATSNN